MHPVISVITPVYNTPRALFEACVDSVLAQDFPDFEMIVVDDGSDAPCAAMLDEVAARDGRVSVFHIADLGVSAARNTALDNATGEFITFVDSDDLIPSAFFSSALAVARDTEADIVAGRVRFLRSTGIIEHRFSRGEHVVVFEGESLASLRRMLLTKAPVDEATDGLGGFSPYTIYPKLYRRELADGIRFDTRMTIGEDSLFSLLLAERAHKVVLVDEAWYEYRDNSDSVTHTTDVSRVCAQLEGFEVYAELREAHGWSASDVGMRYYQSYVNIMISNSPKCSFPQMVTLVKAMGTTHAARMLGWVDKSQYRLSKKRVIFFDVVRTGSPVLIALLAKLRAARAR